MRPRRIHIDGGSLAIAYDRISNDPGGILDDDPATVVSGSIQNCLSVDATPIYSFTIAP